MKFTCPRGTVRKGEKCVPVKCGALRRDSDGDGVPDYMDCRPFDPRRQDYGLDDDEQKAVESELGGEIVRNFDDQRGNIVELDNGEEWLIFEDSSAAESACEDYVREMLEEDPGSFTQSWLQSYVYISDTDRRILAGEEADNYVDNVDNEQLLKDADMDDEYDELQEQIDIFAEKGDDDAVAALEEQQEDLVEKAKDETRDEKYNEIYDELEDPIDYFVNKQGIYSEEELLKANFIQIDVDEAAEDAVNTDGVGHFFASYDGNETELKNGMVAYRVN